MTRMMPPQSSACSFLAYPQPNLIPKMSPHIDMTKETKPMMPTGGRISEQSRMPKKANETPMARASMLVATASVRTTLSLVGSKRSLQSSSLKDARIIRPPRKRRMPKAIQWSKELIKRLNILAPSQPNSGMMPWKSPKKNAITSIGRHWKRLKMMPLAIETARQSIAKPIASSQSSNPVMGLLVWKFINQCVRDAKV